LYLEDINKIYCLKSIINFHRVCILPITNNSKINKAINKQEVAEGSPTLGVKIEFLFCVKQLQL